MTAGAGARWFTVTAAVGVVICAFLPWAASGRASRTSFELLRSAERLDLLHGGWQHAMTIGWYLMPVAVAVLWLASVTVRPVIVAILGTAVGALAVVLALTVRSSPLRPEIGTSATIVTGGLAAVGAAATAWTTRRPHE